MLTHAVIWIDHKEARIFHVSRRARRRHDGLGAAAPSSQASERAW